MPFSPKNIWRKLGLGIGIFLLVVLGTGQFFKKDLIRLQFVLTLFEPAGIVENFRSMTRVFDYRPVRRSGPVYRIPLRKQTSPRVLSVPGTGP